MSILGGYTQVRSGLCMQEHGEASESHRHASSRCPADQNPENPLGPGAGRKTTKAMTVPLAFFSKKLPRCTFRSRNMPQNIGQNAVCNLNRQCHFPSNNESVQFRGFRKQSKLSSSLTEMFSSSGLVSAIFAPWQPCCQQRKGRRFCGRSAANRPKRAISAPSGKTRSGGMRRKIRLPRQNPGRSFSQRSVRPENFPGRH